MNISIPMPYPDYLASTIVVLKDRIGVLNAMLSETTPLVKELDTHLETLKTTEALLAAYLSPPVVRLTKKTDGPDKYRLKPVFKKVLAGFSGEFSTASVVRALLDRGVHFNVGPAHLILGLLNDEMIDGTVEKIKSDKGGPATRYRLIPKVDEPADKFPPGPPPLVFEAE